MRKVNINTADRRHFHHKSLRKCIQASHKHTDLRTNEVRWIHVQEFSGRQAETDYFRIKPRYRRARRTKTSTGLTDKHRETKSDQKKTDCWKN